MISRRTEISGVRDHYLCLYGTAEKLMDETAETACLVHAVRDHRDAGMPMINFDRTDLLPPMAEREDEAQVFYLKLLHEGNHNFGYSMVHYDPEQVPSRCFVQTNVLLSIALENIRRQRELISLYEERRLSSITDMLTGLHNRRGLLEKVEPVWRELIGQRIAFVCIDMDHLKQINDSYGHAAGDFAIRLVGQAIHETLPEGTVGSRIGGDEFVVFMAEGRKAEAFVEAFEEKLCCLNQEEDRSFTVTASIGVTVKELNEMDTIESCVRTGDRALYRAKEARHSMG
jgi:diguanylate cyclase (GGDEF)-like protein